MKGEEFIKTFYEGNPDEVNLLGVSFDDDGKEFFWHIHRDEEITPILKGFRFAKPYHKNMEHMAKMCNQCNSYIVFKDGLCSGCIKEPEMTPEQTREWMNKYHDNWTRAHNKLLDIRKQIDEFYGKKTIEGGKKCQTT